MAYDIGEISAKLAIYTITTCESRWNRVLREKNDR